jgi:hypothetical protein
LGAELSGVALSLVPASFLSDPDRKFTIAYRMGMVAHFANCGGAN